MFHRIVLHLQRDTEGKKEERKWKAAVDVNPLGLTIDSTTNQPAHSMTHLHFPKSAFDCVHSTYLDTTRWRQKWCRLHSQRVAPVFGPLSEHEMTRRRLRSLVYYQTPVATWWYTVSTIRMIITREREREREIFYALFWFFKSKVQNFQSKETRCCLISTVME